MTFTLTTECPHGVKITTVDEDPEAVHDAEWTLYLRAVLLACPRCRHDAEAFIEEPGP